MTVPQGVTDTLLHDAIDSRSDLSAETFLRYVNVERDRGITGAPECSEALDRMTQPEIGDRRRPQAAEDGSDMLLHPGDRLIGCREPGAKLGVSAQGIVLP